MRNLWLALFAFSSVAAQGQAPKSSLSLDQYLEQVKNQNPEARAMVEQVKKAELRLDEAEYSLSPEFYTSFSLYDDKDEPTSPFSGSRKKDLGWTFGVRDNTQYGLSTDVSFKTSHGQIEGIPSSFNVMDDYYDSRLGLQLKQSLWRNGFGAYTRANIEMQKGASRVELLSRQFELKNLLLKAENAYWTIVSLNQIVRLQEENVGRAKRLMDWMDKRVNLRLADDVDGLQAQASFESRDLDLQTSLDERASMIRQFNTLRGLDTEDVEILSELPDKDMILKMSRDSKQRMSREDFKIIYEKAGMAKAEARGAKSQINPQLDLTAAVYSNGLDRKRSESWSETEDLHNPTWQVGVMFSIPLDYSLLGKMRRSYDAASRAAESLAVNARFSEERAWKDLLAQKAEAQRKFERALALEKTQTELVKRERERLLNGRTTTFQTITFEQNLASAQIQRVRAQVGLIQINNVLKTWEAQ